MSDIRLLPILLVAATALLTLKLMGIFLMGGFLFQPIFPAVAQTQSDSASSQEAPSDIAVDDALDESDEQEPLGGRLVSPGEVVSGSRTVLMERLSARRHELEQREKEIDMRETLLQAAEQRFEARLSEMKVLEARVEKMIVDREAADNERLKGLVAMYESMKPKDAARIFSTLNINVLVKLVTRMDVRKMANILAEMDGRMAQKLTLEIAGQQNMKKDLSARDAELPRIDGVLPES